MIRLVVDPNLADVDASFRQYVRRDPQDVVFEATWLGFEKQGQRPFSDQQVRIYLGQVGLLK